MFSGEIFVIGTGVLYYQDVRMLVRIVINTTVTVVYIVIIFMPLFCHVNSHIMTVAIFVMQSILLYPSLYL